MRRIRGRENGRLAHLVQFGCQQAGLPTAAHRDNQKKMQKVIDGKMAVA